MNKTVPSTFWYSLRENIVSIILGSAIFCGFYCWFWGLGLDGIVRIGVNALTICAVLMVVDDWEYKRVFAPKMLVWQEYVGLVLALLAIFGHYAFAFDDGIRGQIGSIVMVVAAVTCFFWFKGPYTVAVLSASPESLDAFMRKRYARAIKKGKEKKVRKTLGKFLRYQQLGDNYFAGSDFARPFDDQLRCLDEVKSDYAWQKFKAKIAFRKAKKDAAVQEAEVLRREIQMYEEKFTVLVNAILANREVK